MTAHEQHLEGQLRFVNSRVITNSEEISFYQGNSRERVTLNSTFDQLVRDGRGRGESFVSYFFVFFCSDWAFTEFCSVSVLDGVHRFHGRQM